MKIKRLQMRDLKRDILLGIVPDPCTFGKLVYEEENEKVRYTNDWFIVFCILDFPIQSRVNQRGRKILKWRLRLGKR